MARINRTYYKVIPIEVSTFTPNVGGLVPASGLASPASKILHGDAIWRELSTTSLTDFTESVQDIVGSQIVAGANVIVTYDDITGQITIASSGGGGGGLSDGDYGDITVSGTGTVMNIDAGVVTTTELGGDITTAGKALLDDTDASAQRITLGLGTAATSNTGDFAAASHSHIIGDITGLQTALDNKLDDSQASAYGLTLLDDVDAATARTTLGLGTLATQSGTFSGTSSGTNTGDQNLFSTISVSGQSDVVADSTSDTLTLVAGTNVTITTSAAGDSITINSSGGGGGLSDADYGDITVSGTGTVMTIDNDVVTYAKMQNVSATDKLLGRSTAGAGDVEEITCTSAGRALIDDANASAQRTTLGLGTLATQSGTFSGTSSGTNTGDQTITLTSDVTGSGTGSFATTIASGAVSLSKMANMATASILGRNTAGTGSPEVLSAATTKTLLSLNNVENTALSTWAGTTNLTTLGTIATGSWNATNIPLGKGGTGAALTDPNADRVMFWDDSAGAVTWLTMGTNLTITGTTLDATGGGGGNSFETIAVSGQSNVVADSSTDTLTLVAGTNVTITTDAATDSITINASLSGGSVSGPGSSTDNALVRWDGTGGATLQNGSAILEDGGNLSLVSTDAGASGGPALNFHRDSASPAASDIIGQFIFAGEDSGSNYTNYGLIQGVISNPTDGSEGGDLYIQTVQAGTLADRVVIQNDGEIRTKINSSACEGVVESSQWVMLTADYTLTSSTVIQKCFNNTTNGTLTLPTGIYYYESWIYVTGTSSTSGNMAFTPLGGGTAVTDRWGHSFTGIDNTNPLNAGTWSGSGSVTDKSPASATTASTGTGQNLNSRGMFRVTTGGTIIPSLQLVTAAAAVVKAGSWFKITRCGSTSESSVGAWT